MQYYTNCNGQQSATISANSATITISSCSRTLYYRLCDDRNCSGWNTVGNIGAYVILATEYNQFLWTPSTCASNNNSNISYHVERSGTLKQKLIDVANTAISNKAGYSNRDFVTIAYHGLLGRAPDTGGLNGYTNALNNGSYSRAYLVQVLLDSAEGQGIRSAWGY